MDELKPCPFCGTTPKAREHDFGGEYRTWIVECGDSDCPALRVRAEDLSEADAITAWNTRAASGGDSASLEQRARRLLGLQYRNLRNHDYAEAIMRGDAVRSDSPELLAITAALANQQGVGGALPAPARTREMEKDAGPFYAACQRACAELPNGWEIRVCLEKDAGTVELCDPDGGSSYMDVDADDRLTAEVHAAIDAAKATQPAGDVA